MTLKQLMGQPFRGEGPHFKPLWIPRFSLLTPQGIPFPPPKNPFLLGVSFLLICAETTLLLTINLILLKNKLFFGIQSNFGWKKKIYIQNTVVVSFNMAKLDSVILCEELGYSSGSEYGFPCAGSVVLEDETPPPTPNYSTLSHDLQIGGTTALLTARFGYPSFLKKMALNQSSNIICDFPRADFSVVARCITGVYLDFLIPEANSISTLYPNIAVTQFPNLIVQKSCSDSVSLRVAGDRAPQQNKSVLDITDGKDCGHVARNVTNTNVKTPIYIAKSSRYVGPSVVSSTARKFSPASTHVTHALCPFVTPPRDLLSMQRKKAGLYIVACFLNLPKVSA